MKTDYDIAVVGGGIMGCATALRLAEGGMKTIILEKGDLCQGASGVNAGTLSLQIKRVQLMEYALRGHAIWQAMGEAVGFQKTGGYTLAFNQREAELLLERQTLKRDAGAPVEFVSNDHLRSAEPELSQKVVAASFCPEDGFANSSLTGAYYRARLKASDVPYLEHCPVIALDNDCGSFTLHSPKGQVKATRVLLATGAWLKALVSMLGVVLPVRARVNTVSVTEAMPPLCQSVIGHATGLLTLKQKPNGTFLIGGGWQGVGKPEAGRGSVSADTLVPNLALACHVLPALKNARILRSWTGFEANMPDFYPLAGALPGVENAFVLGCVRGGFTIGPYIGQLMGDHILNRAPELPLFDPARSYEGAM